VAAAIGVELAEAPVAPEHVRDRLQGGARPLLLDEAGVEDAPVRIVEHHHQVLHGQAGNPLVRRGIEVQHHPHQRPSLPLAPVLAAPGRFAHHAAQLQHVAREGVGHLEPVLLDDLLMKVTQREVRIDVALQPAELLDGRLGDALLAREPEAAVHQTCVAEDLVPPPQAPQLPGTEPKNVRRLHPSQRPRCHHPDHFHPRHGLRLKSYPSVVSGHPLALQAARLRRTSLTAHGADISGALYSALP